MLSLWEHLASSCVPSPPEQGLEELPVPDRAEWSWRTGEEILTAGNLGSVSQTG